MGKPRRDQQSYYDKETLVVRENRMGPVFQRGSFDGKSIHTFVRKDTSWIRKKNVKDNNYRGGIR